MERKTTMEALFSQLNYMFGGDAVERRAAELQPTEVLELVYIEDLDRFEAEWHARRGDAS